MSVLLEMKDIEKSFNDTAVLKKVDFSVKAGEVHALMGENGAGKSTLIKILTGIYPKDGGQIYWNGQPVEIRNRTDASKLGIGVIYQELSLIPTLTVMQNVMLGKEEGRAGIINTKKMKKKSIRIDSEIWFRDQTGCNCGDTYNRSKTDNRDSESIK